jgi:type III pantothenate kinase
MNAVIDIGNTQAKIGLFQSDSKLQVSVVDTKQISKYLKLHGVTNTLVCNVSQSDDFFEELKVKIGALSVFNIDTPMPIRTTYETPKTLGVDRLAACVGARNYTSGNVLVIDAGSCITFDLLSATNEHLGGLISPGLNMRLKSMHTLTSNLPLVPFDEVPLVGSTTEKCLQSGVANGTLAEVKGLIMEFQKKFEDLSIIIGGGDAVFFDKNLKKSTFVVPNLAVEGLHAIFKYNE